MTSRIGIRITGSGFVGKPHAEEVLLLTDLRLVTFSGGSRAPGVCAGVRSRLRTRCRESSAPPGC